MQDELRQFLDWSSWNWQDIWATVIATAIVAWLAVMAGLPRRAYNTFLRVRGERRFDRKTKAACETLIAVGRREGFKLSDVYVPMDIVPSDLANVERAPHWRFRGSFVLLGGPGAGKSTWVKHQVANYPLGRAILIRLRDVGGELSISGIVARNAALAGIPSPEKWAERQLREPRTLLVLDGLDEVPARNWDAVCHRINEFFLSYASPDQGLTLIVTCRKEAFRAIPIEIPDIREVRPLTDEQIERFAAKWPLGYPEGKNKETFLRDLRETERILQLARSPLMLVGALMQYTESNLGIPDERKDYLERIARWLVEDWAKAQGHPADPWKKAYDRVLGAIAFEMHARGVAELPRDDAAKIVRELLPTLGLDGGKTDAFIETLITKTGILVRDIPGFVVFAQFSLQEYFASRHAAAFLSPEAIAELEPRGWWREAILLAVAQQADPSAHFVTLFDTDALLAAAAVAEYPTPPLVFQGRATSVILEGIDRATEKAGDVAISLARKIEGKHERDLIGGLEERLQSVARDTAMDAGRVLAIAGTVAANEALGRNPAILREVLSKAGYFSASFEALLMSWIRGKDPERAALAASLILTRLSDDRRAELVTLLPELPKGRAALVATGLVESFEEPHFSPWGASREMLRVGCYCAAHLGTPEQVTPSIVVLQKPALAVARVAQQVLHKSEQRPEKLLRLFLDGAEWSYWRQAILWGAASSALILTTAVEGPIRYLFMGVFGLAVIVGIAAGRAAVPWVPLPTELNTALLFAAVLGAATAAMFASGIGLNHFDPVVAALTALVLAIMAIHDHGGPLIWTRTRSPRPMQIVLTVWVACSLIFAGVVVILESVAPYVGLFFGVIGTAAAGYYGIRYWWCFRVVRQAAKQVFDETPFLAFR